MSIQLFVRHYLYRMSIGRRLKLLIICYGRMYTATALHVRILNRVSIEGMFTIHSKRFPPDSIVLHVVHPLYVVPLFFVQRI